MDSHLSNATDEIEVPEELELHRCSTNGDDDDSSSIECITHRNGDAFVTPIPNVGQKRSGRSTATIWSHFTDEDNPHLLKSAICKNCHELYSHHKKSEQAKTQE
jgi:hypothetical protein